MKKNNRQPREDWALDTKPLQVRYVSYLLLEAIRDGIPRIVLRESETLPAIDIWQSDAEYPLFSLVYNRLKVMAQLDAVTYPEPKSGTIKLSIGPDWDKYNIMATFHDSVDDPYCELEIEKENS